MNATHLSLPALNWAVAKVLKLENVSVFTEKNGQPEIRVVHYSPERGHVELHFAEDWAHGGPIVDQWWNVICRQAIKFTIEQTEVDENPKLAFWMRCLVAFELGEVIDLPETLT